MTYVKISFHPLGFGLDNLVIYNFTTLVSTSSFLETEIKALSGRWQETGLSFLDTVWWHYQDARRR